MLSQDWPIEALYPNHKNPRWDVRNDPDYPGLLASIKSQGIIQPLLINKEGMILAGHRRYAVALDLGLQRVPVRVVPDKNNHTLIPLIENLQRADLSVMEIADYLLTCRNDHGLTLSAMSEIVGIGETTIGQYLKLAQGPQEIRDRIERDEITLGAALALIGKDKAFIREVIKEPVLTRAIVRERAKAFRAQPPVRDVDRMPAPDKCPTDRVPHLKHAIRVVRELLAAAPDESFEVRYKRWLNVMEDDLNDIPDISTFRGAADPFQRQPIERKSHG